MFNNTLLVSDFPVNEQLQVSSSLPQTKKELTTFFVKRWCNICPRTSNAIFKQAKLFLNELQGKMKMKVKNENFLKKHFDNRAAGTDEQKVKAISQEILDIRRTTTASTTFLNKYNSWQTSQ